MCGWSHSGTNHTHQIRNYSCISEDPANEVQYYFGVTLFYKDEWPGKKKIKTFEKLRLALIKCIKAAKGSSRNLLQ